MGLYWVYIGVILGLYWVYIGVILGLYWVYIGVIRGIMEKKMEITIMGYMSGCQNYGPFFGYPKYQVPYYNSDPKKGPQF